MTARSGAKRRKLAETRFGRSEGHLLPAQRPLPSASLRAGAALGATATADLSAIDTLMAVSCRRRAELSAIGKTLAGIAAIPATRPARVSCPPSETSKSINRLAVAEIAEIGRRVCAPSGRRPRCLTGVGVAPILPHRKNGLKSRKHKAF